MHFSKKFKNKNILIVGGSGFIGQNLVKKALNYGFNVTVISKNKLFRKTKVQGVRYLSIDIRNENKLSNSLKKFKFEYVLNLSGYVDHSDFSKNGHTIIHTHFNGTINLIKAINLKYIKTFIQIGSSDEYGLNTGPQKEFFRERPISPYSFAKTASTHFLQMLHLTEKFPVIVLRPFIVYGVGQKIDRFIPQIIKGCLMNKSFAVSPGKQIRDFCYIDDFVEAVFLSLNKKTAYGEVINISTGTPISVKDVVKKIVKIIGAGRPNFGRLKYRHHENMKLVGNASKAKKLLGWRAKTKIDKGLLLTIESIIKNEN